MKENVECVKYTDILNSIEYKFMQLSDIIAGIAKISSTSQLLKDKVSNRDAIRILDPDYIDVFPRSQSKYTL